MQVHKWVPNLKEINKTHNPLQRRNHKKDAKGRDHRQPTTNPIPKKKKKKVTKSQMKERERALVVEGSN
jgi:hypothetical protein